MSDTRGPGSVPGARPRSTGEKVLLGVVAVLLTALLVPCVLMAHAGISVGVAAVRGVPLDEPELADPWAIATTAVLCATLVLAGVLSARRDRRRRRQVERWAAERGWRTDVARTVLVGRWEAPPFGRGGGVATDAVERDDERGRIRSFTYNGLRRRHVVMVERAMRGPGLVLTPERGAQRLARRLGGQDVTVEWEDFNARWRIQAGRARFAHAVLHPQVMERLSRPDTDGLSVLVEGADVAVHVPGRTDLGRIESLAQVALDLAELLPAFVVDDHPPLPAGLTRREVQALDSERWSEEAL
ncbi:hypothetical protein [Cellulomonas soli]|uniref:Uncharacterized protein n=1 Tax=Cellulomonas soli TaxID=931535 RepID=A0A512PC63_9CELL|nr:hypothetical protein [Cellulomonas soli]NYI58373.1 hypothetical protein [Cellulomonas soli]GEP68794.1 hypothetical protein CSO01_15090 [Cellulomonas soli]